MLIITLKIDDTHLRPEDISDADIQFYIKEALGSYGGSYDSFDPLFEGLHVVHSEIVGE